MYYFAIVVSYPNFKFFFLVFMVMLFSGAFIDAISSMEFDYVASGHYANVVHSFTDQMDKPSVLELSKDMVPM